MTNPIITVEALVKDFRRIRALDRLSLTVAEGAVYGLLGPNGAGKTTLIRILATLLRPDAGSARIAGFDVLSEAPLVRGRIGLAGQFAAIDDHLSGRENITMIGRLYGLPRRVAEARAEEVLHRIGLTEAAGRKVRSYSGGMRRRVDLAASLVGRPRVLFLDEPTTGIDPASRRGIWHMIRELAGDGTTVLLSTQYLEEADRLADRIAVIDHGHVISEGTAAELKSRTGTAVVELEVDESDRTTAAAALGPLGATLNRGSDRIVLTAPDGPVTLSRMLRLLDEAGIAAVDVAMHRPSLEDVFLSLTGYQITELPVETAGRPAP